MVVGRVVPPTWFRVAVFVLLLWDLTGCYACLRQFQLGADAMGPASDYDRALYASLPVWYNAVYAVATVIAAAAMVALLLRSTLAIPLTVISLVAVIVQFGWLFATTDIVAVKGAWTGIFPLCIAAVSVFAVWLARHARARGWIV